jgi:hypothetical protein
MIRGYICPFNFTIEIKMIDDATRSRVAELHEGKKSLREIAAELNITKSAVTTALKKLAAAAPPKIIISEIKPVEMDSKKADDFMNSLVSAAPAPAAAAPAAKKTAAGPKPVPDSFLAALMADDEPKPKRGRQTKAAAPPPPKREARAQTPPPRVMDKGELIGKITLNVQTFPEMLADIVKPNREEFIEHLPKKSQSELTGLLSLIEYQRSVTNTAAVMKTLTLTGASLLEMGTKRFLKMRTEGFADMLKNEPSIDGILKEIAMENANGIISKYQSPTARLTLLVVTSLMSVDARNRQRSGAAPVPEAVTNKYNDL